MPYVNRADRNQNRIVGMSSFLTFMTLLVMGLVVIVLVRGLVNMAKGGSGNTSNKLMQARVLLQAIAIILIMLTLTGGLINAVQTTMFALAAHVYPTPIRAGGVGTVVAFGRLGAILVGYAGPWALEYRGSESFFWLMAAALVVTCVSLATVRRHVPAR